MVRNLYLLSPLKDNTEISEKIFTMFLLNMTRHSFIGHRATDFTIS